MAKPAQFSVVCPEKSSSACWWKTRPGKGQAARKQASDAGKPELVLLSGGNTTVEYEFS